MVYWFTAIYALYPGILTFCGMIITESLSISLMTALLYLISEAYYRNSFKKAVFSGLLCLILWLLRPALMSVTFMTLVFWGVLLVFRRKQFKKAAIGGFCASLVSLAGIGIYSMMFYKEYDKVGLTCVSTYNNYFLIREAGVIETDLVENPETKAMIDSIIGVNGPVVRDRSGASKNNVWGEVLVLHKELGISEFDKFVNLQIKHHPKEIVSFLYHDRLERFLCYDCVEIGYQDVLHPHVKNLVTRIIRVKNGTAFLIFLIGLSILILVDFKKRRISYFIWLLYSFFAANYFTIWVGAMGEYDRLAAPNYPVLLAISCWLMNMLVHFAVDDKKE